MPFDGNDASAASSNKLVKAKISTEALKKLMEVGDSRWRTICQAATTTGTVAPSKNKGRSNAINAADPRYEPLRQHFNELCGLGEVRATRYVRKEVDGVLTRTEREEDDNIYLPCSHGKRRMYYRYLSGCGWRTKADDRSNLSYVAIDGVDQHDYVGWATYRRFWKREYPRL